MKFNAKLLPSVCILVFLLPEFSKEEKPEDCKPGLQYWSAGRDDHSIIDVPHCAPCPRNLADCDSQPINDRKSCYNSCGKQRTSSTTVIRPSTTIRTTPRTTAILEIVVENPPIGGKIPFWLLIVLIMLGLAVVIVPTLLLVFFCLSERRRRIKDSNGGGSTGEEDMPLRCLSTEGTAPANVITDNEDYVSSYNLPEYCS